mmetsp:Transcript_68487/g.155191  ORF Transcript_68487/g.155191 Transcript_68487/m.155191 type:complete len:245 (-) Transcript_68487:97-831(-)
MAPRSAMPAEDAHAHATVEAERASETISPGYGGQQMPPSRGSGRGRPLFSMASDPYQNDRSYSNRMDIARSKASGKQGRTTPVVGSSMSSTLGWSHGRELGTGDLGDRHETPSRAHGSPAGTQRVFLCKSLGHSNSVGRLSGGGSSASFPGSAAHLPGYKGHVPGYRFESQSLGSSFGRATASLDHLRSSASSLELTAGRLVPPQVTLPVRGGEGVPGQMPCREAAAGGPWTPTAAPFLIAQAK